KKGLFSMDKVTKKCEKEDSLMMFGSSTPMVIKFKIPKANTEEGKRVCSVCKKDFSSGKALGGHMRVHVMYHKNSPFKTGSKLFKKIGYNQDFSGGAKGDEGLKVTINKPQLSSVNDEGVPTCFQCGNSFPSMNDEDDEDLLESAKDLMSLANGHRSSVIKESNSNANSPPLIDKREGSYV
nr:zinc finger C2H2-type/integrase DNA-binding domain-containing protein [Tanacetum cinerariifolium]